MFGADNILSRKLVTDEIIRSSCSFSSTSSTFGLVLSHLLMFPKS